MLERVKRLAMALVLLAVGGCACCNTLVLESGEKVDSLYYHESRMPDEVMVEMWIDFDTRRFRFKCGLHDAMGWDSCRFDGVRLDLSMEGREWRRLVEHIQRANLEAWPGIDERQTASPLDTTSYCLRMRVGDRRIERFAVGVAPGKFEEIQSVIQFALTHESLRQFSHVKLAEKAAAEQAKPDKCRTFPFEWTNPDSETVCPEMGGKAQTSL